jgi:Ca2+-binding EF-hand superfamily protein
VLEATVWLQQIVRAMGGRQERMLLEHMIHQSVKMKNFYIMMISLLNFANLNKQKMPQNKKLVKILKEYKIHSNGGRPIWNDVLMMV